MGLDAVRRPFLDLDGVGFARGDVVVPGSKSITIRALLLAALAEGETRLTGALRSDDTDVMLDALRALGVDVRDDGGSLAIDGASHFPNAAADLFVGNSGLSVRTLVAALAFAGGRYRLAGIARMHERPIGDLVDALRRAGARITYEGADGFPPLFVEPPSLPPPSEAGGRLARSLHVRGNASSQFLTGLLQAAPSLTTDADLTIDVEGELISRPYIDLTIALMGHFGVTVREAPRHRFTIERGARYASPGAFAIEGDASSASYLLAAGLLGGGPVRVEGLGRASLQGDARFVDVVVAMGAEVMQSDHATEVRSPGVASGFRLRAIDADLNDIPDAAMTAAVLALFADGPSTLRNIGSWRVKETDRLAAMTTELRKFGAAVEVGDDWLRIAPPGAASLEAESIEIETYDDHRIAMCFSLATFLGRPVRIVDPDCVAKTFPDYFERFTALVTPS